MDNPLHFLTFGAGLGLLLTTANPGVQGMGALLIALVLVLRCWLRSELMRAEASQEIAKAETAKAQTVQAMVERGINNVRIEHVSAHAPKP